MSTSTIRRIPSGAHAPTAAATSSAWRSTTRSAPAARASAAFSGELTVVATRAPAQRASSIAA